SSPAAARWSPSASTSPPTRTGPRPASTSCSLMNLTRTQSSRCCTTSSGPPRPSASPRRSPRPDLRQSQPQVLPQRGPLVLAAEASAPLQHGHDLVDEVLDPAGEGGRHEVEAVGRARVDPPLDLVG